MGARGGSIERRAVTISVDFSVKAAGALRWRLSCLIDVVAFAAGRCRARVLRCSFVRPTLVVLVVPNCGSFSSPYRAGTTNAVGKLKASSKAELGAICKEYANPTTDKASHSDITTGGSECNRWLGRLDPSWRSKNL